LSLWKQKNATDRNPQRCHEHNPDLEVVVHRRALRIGEQDAAQQRSVFVAALVLHALHGVGLEQALDGSPRRFIDNGVVLALVEFVLKRDFAEVVDVAQ
jgi:hypothetical protein